MNTSIQTKFGVTPPVSPPSCVPGAVLPLPRALGGPEGGLVLPAEVLVKSSRRRSLEEEMALLA